MLKGLGKMLGLDSASNLAGEVKRQFESDYIQDQSFLKNFSDNVAPYIRDHINGSYEAASSSENAITFNDPIYHIFGCLKAIYISLWLEKTGYGEKLALKQRQLIYKDSYGDYCFDDWNNELKRFISKRLYDLSYELDSTIPEKYTKFAAVLKLDYMLRILVHDPNFSEADLVEDLALDISTSLDPYYEAFGGDLSANLDCIEDPYEYEKAVSATFEGLGWESYATAGSGDQGADVIAEKKGKKLVVQCKLYTSPVGNKSVQEVSAAQHYYHAHLSAVISNQTFTKSAMQLAESLDVYLLHHSQLQDFDELIFTNDDYDVEFDEFDEPFENE